MADAALGSSLSAPSMDRKQFAATMMRGDVVMKHANGAGSTGVCRQARSTMPL